MAALQKRGTSPTGENIPSNTSNPTMKQAIARDQLEQKKEKNLIKEEQETRDSLRKEESRLRQEKSTAAQSSSSGGTSETAAFIILFFSIALYIADVFYLNFNGIDITIFSNLDFFSILTKSGFITGLGVILIFQFFLSKIDWKNKDQAIWAILSDVMLVTFFIIGGRSPGSLFHMFLILAIWYFMWSEGTPDKGYKALALMLFFDFIGYSAFNMLFTWGGMTELALVFGNRLVFPVLIITVLYFLNKRFKNGLAGAALIIIFLILLFGAVKEYVDARAYMDTISDEQKDEALEFGQTGVNRLGEFFASTADVISCALTDPLNENCHEEKYYERHPEELEEIESQRDPEKIPTKIYFQSTGNQKIPSSGIVGIDADLYVQGVEGMNIELGCEIKRGDVVIYSGRADPESYPLNKIGNTEAKHITVTCKPDAPFEAAGKNYITTFSANVKRHVSYAPLKRVIVRNEEWIEDFTQSPYSRAPYGYNREEVSAANEELGAIQFKVGSETLLDLQNFHKLSGYIMNKQSGRITKIYEGSILLNSPLLKPSEDCKDIYDYDIETNELSLRSENIPSPLSMEKISKDSQTKPIPQCNIEVDAQAESTIPDRGGKVVDIKSKLVYDYLVKSNEIRFEVESEI